MALFGRYQFLLSQGATKLNRRPSNNPNRVILSDVTNFLPITKSQTSEPSHVPGVIKNTHFLNAISTRDSCFPRDIGNHNNVVVVETEGTKYVFVDGLADHNSTLPQVANVLQQGGLIRIVDVGDGGNNRKSPSSAEEKLTSYDHQVTKILQTLQLDTGKAVIGYGKKLDETRVKVC